MGFRTFPTVEPSAEEERIDLGPSRAFRLSQKGIRRIYELSKDEALADGDRALLHAAALQLQEGFLRR